MVLLILVPHVSQDPRMLVLALVTLIQTLLSRGLLGLWHLQQNNSFGAQGCFLLLFFELIKLIKSCPKTK
ncbi:MAG: hypothetical protein ABH827_03025 [bacterium]